MRQLRNIHLYHLHFPRSDFLPQLRGGEDQLSGPAECLNVRRNRVIVLDEDPDSGV